MALYLDKSDYALFSSPDLKRWLVMTVEKNRAGRARVYLEYALDAAHFRLISKGGYVRERLIDDRLTLE